MPRAVAAERTLVLESAVLATNPLAVEIRLVAASPTLLLTVVVVDMAVRFTAATVSLKALPVARVVVTTFATAVEDASLTVSLTVAAVVARSAAALFAAGPPFVPIWVK